MRILTIFTIIGLVSACTTPTTPSTNTTSSTSSSVQMSEVASETSSAMMIEDLSVTPIEHATMVLTWSNMTFYTDPVGGAAAFTNQPEPNFILITDIHGDHLDAETVTAVATSATEIIAPQAVFDELPSDIQEQTVVLDNDDMRDLGTFRIIAVPMYNLPESDDSRHIKGRGNGYIIEHDEKRVYISGDTADIPEMRNLENIDVAFVCMNEPYTMNAATAADAVLDFAPTQVYPYHYRQPDGFADVEAFKQIVEAGSSEIEVVQLDWYPEN